MQIEVNSLESHDLEFELFPYYILIITLKYRYQLNQKITEHYVFDSFSC